MRNSEERFRAIINQATAGICQAQLDGKLTLTNRKMCEMLGYAESELINKTIWDLIYTGDLAESQEKFKRLESVAEPFVLENRLVRKDGSPIWVNISVAPISDKAGKPEFIAAVIIDISERKHVLGLDKETAINVGNVPLLTHIGKPDDVAYGALYLASNESKFVTGEELVIDGGLVTE